AVESADAVALQAPQKRRAMPGERACGLGAVAAALAQRFGQALALELLERPAQPTGRGRVLEALLGAPPKHLLVHRQIDRQDDIVLGQERCPLEGVLELAHVAGP